MAAVLTKPQATSAKVEAQLSQELAQATSRIRLADLLAGGLALVVLVLGYTLAAVVADRLFVLPAAARLAGLAIFLAALAVTAWAAVLRPLRARVNPRFAARQVERTLPDGKNAIINWVDLKERDLPASVRAAVGARAAEGVAGADVAGVGESRRVLALVAAAGLLAAGLAVFFLAVKSAPFFSLLNRAYNPFTAAGIATRTTITLDEPAGGDAVVTSGDALTVRVTLAGSLPDPKSPERARLLVRYSADAEEFEELPLDPAGSRREFAAKLPPSVVQNGFRYRVAAGDARTPEYAVTVRTRPMLRDFAVKYAYPAYTRLQPEATADPRVEGYRGTQVTLTARANRPVRDARLVFDSQLTQVAGAVDPATPEAVTFRFALEESCNYRVVWTAADGEAAESAAYPVRVLVDRVPQVSITSPKDEATALPAGGLLKVDGVAADDFGLTALTLRLRVAGTPPVALEAKKYRGGKPLRRAADQSDPTALEYKDSVKLADLKTAAGDAVKLEPGTVVEYWLEAADNCTVPAANVGRSKVQRVTIAPPPPPAEQKASQENQQREQGERQKQEQDHQAKQDAQLDKEQRPPPQPHPENVEKRPGDKQPGEGDPKPGDPNAGQQKPGDPKPNEGKEPPKKEAGGEPPQQGNDPGKTAEQKPQPQPGSAKELNPQGAPPKEGTPKEQPGDKSTPPKEDAGRPGDQSLQEQADKVQKALDDKQRQGGDARPPETNPEGTPPAKPDDTRPGQTKPSPGNAQPPEPSGEPKPKPGGEQSGKPDTAPSEGKTPPANGADKPEASQPKPESGGEQPGANPQQKPAGGSDAKPAEPKKERPGPGDAGKEKPTPGDANSPPKKSTKPDANGDKQAGEGRPPEGAPPKKSDGGKPSGEAKSPPDGPPGQERAPSSDPEPKAGDAPKTGDARGSQGKPEKPAQPAVAKLAPKGGADGPPESAPKPTEGKPGDGDDAAQPKPDAPKGASGAQPKAHDKGSEKPAGGKGDSVAKKPDANEIADAVKDLQSGDKQKQDAAREKLDKAVGKEAREAAEKKAAQLERDLKSDDPAKREAARKEIEEFAKQAEKNGPGGDKTDGDKKDGSETGDAGKQPTAEQLKEFQQAAQDLASKDDAKREAAERKLDDAVGKGRREKLQQAMQDAQSGDPKKAEAGKKALDEMAKAGDKSKGSPRGPADRPGTEGDKLKDDPANRKKTADLQLQQFEKAKADREFLKKLGYTPEQYDEFMKGYREMTARRQAQPPAAETLPAPKEAGPATIRVGDGGAKPLEKKPDGSAATAGGVGGTAPPGFTEAQRRFAEEAAKLRRPDAKK